MKKLIAAWLLPLLLLAGCAPQAETSVVQPDDTGSPVYTDWSKLTPYEPQSPVYTYHAGYSGADRFQPRDDYGALLPYIGRYASMEQYVIDALPFYGLVTVAISTKEKWYSKLMEVIYLNHILLLLLPTLNSI